MKKFMLIVAAGLALVACNKEKKDATTTVDSTAIVIEAPVVAEPETFNYATADGKQHFELTVTGEDRENATLKDVEGNVVYEMKNAVSADGANLRGASRIIAVGSRPVTIEAAKGYGATDFISYKEGPIDEQVLKLTDGKGVDKAIIAGGGVETFEPVIKALKPGGKIGNVNYLGSGTYINIPRAEWGVGMGHKQIIGGLMPGGRYRLEKLASLISNKKLDVKPLLTHKFNGFEHVEEALMLMKDKPKDLIKPVVVIEE